MKITDTAKPVDSTSLDGQYDEEDLDDMLEDYIKAKQIEADPAKLAMLKKYALTKAKIVDELFNVNNAPKPKSIKDLKKIYNDKMATDMAAETTSQGESDTAE